MDREEAIDILEYERDEDYFVSEYRNRVHEALDLAIEALEESQTTHDQMDACYMAQKKAIEKLQISKETSTDLISRQAVTDLILDAQDGSGQAYELIRDLLHEVAYMPSIPPEQTQ